MPQTVDARGMACPMPVINTKKILEGMAEGTVTTIVDNEAAKENVAALAKSMGCEVEVRQTESEFYVVIAKKAACAVMDVEGKQDTVIFVSSSEMGRGSAELGGILMKIFMYTVLESDRKPTSMLFVNSGVFLTCEGSPVLEHLTVLGNHGVEILSCGTCLDYFKLKDKLFVGKVTNMYAILEKMNLADKVISM